MAKMFEASVDIVPDLTPLSRGLGEARGMAQGFVSSTNGILAGLGVGVAGAGLTAMFISAAKAAGNLAESVNNVEQTFGGSKATVFGWVNSVADKFGVVKSEANEAASAMGAVLKASGLDQGQAANITVDLMQRAIDAASRFNKSNEDVFQAIRSGLVGEAEPLRPLGVLLSEDAVKAEALALGLAKDKKELSSLSEAAKVAARASLITKGLAPAAGDLDATVGSFNNQVKKLAGDWENFKADFGKGLTDPLVDAIKLLNEFALKLSQMGGGNAASAGEATGDMLKGAVGGARAAVANPLKTLAAGFLSYLPGMAGKIGQSVLQKDADERAGVKKLSETGFGREKDEDAALKAKGIPLNPADARRNAMAKAIEARDRAMREGFAKQAAEIEASKPLGPAPDVYEGDVNRAHKGLSGAADSLKGVLGTDKETAASMLMSALPGGGGNPLLSGFGSLALAGGDRMAEEKQRKMQGPAQMFSSNVDFGQSQQLRLLEPEDKTTEEIRKSNELLKTIATNTAEGPETGGKRAASAAGEAVGMNFGPGKQSVSGVVLKGRS